MSELLPFTRTIVRLGTVTLFATGGLVTADAALNSNIFRYFTLQTKNNADQKAQVIDHPTGIYDEFLQGFPDHAQAALSPQKGVFFSANFQVYLENFHGEVTQLTPNGSFNGLPVPAPNGEHLAYLRNGAENVLYIRIFDFEHSIDRELAPSDFRFRSGITWNKESTELIAGGEYNGESGLFRLTDWQDGPATPQLLSEGESFNFLSLLPQSDAIVGWEIDFEKGATLVKIDTKTGEKQNLTQQLQYYASYALSEDGSQAVWFVPHEHTIVPLLVDTSSVAQQPKLTSWSEIQEAFPQFGGQMPDTAVAYQITQNTGRP